MFSDDITSILVNAGVGVDGQTIFIGSRASLPDGDPPFITIHIEGGGPPEGTHNSTLLPAYVNPSAQIVARGKSYAAAEILAWAAYAAIFPIRNRFVNGTWWRSVKMTQSEPFDLGEDVNSRPRLAFNFDCIKRLSPSTS